MITGYLELNRPLEVKQYINNMIEEMTAQRIIFESVPAEAALYLYEQMLLSTEFGVILRYEELQIREHNQLMKHNEPYRSLALISRQLKYTDDEPVIYLSVYEENNNINRIFRCDQIQENPVLVSIKE